AGEYRLRPRSLDEALGGEIVHLVRRAVGHRLDERVLVEQVGGDELYSVHQVPDSLVRRGGAAPHDADHPVSLLEKELGEVGAILPGDPCYQRGTHSVSPSASVPPGGIL